MRDLLHKLSAANRVVISGTRQFTPYTLPEAGSGAHPEEQAGKARSGSLNEVRAALQLSLAGPHLAPGSQPAAPPPMTASAFGMNLHAATTADGRDRKQPGQLCRYLLRPPFAHDAVTALPGGRVRVSFKAPWRSGTAHADMDAHQFLARLCALVPPPNFQSEVGRGESGERSREPAEARASHFPGCDGKLSWLQRQARVMQPHTMGA
ncbi:MAG: transposase [Pseudomonadota bacterium]|nr:transposase [Pseudomonadota bacterium]